ncbi:MAG: hypothetical protein U1E65_24995 [Myxococcota bacterium]
MTSLLALSLVLLGTPSPPPVVALVELDVAGINVKGVPVDKRVRVAYPKGWDRERGPDGRSVQLIGPGGEGEILVAAFAHPNELGEVLEGLRQRHPSATPSPPETGKVHGIRPKKGERATRFQITGGEVGEMMMIERGGVIVLFATVVKPDAWKDVEAQLVRCYPTVEVEEHAKRAKP